MSAVLYVNTWRANVQAIHGNGPAKAMTAVTGRGPKRENSTVVPLANLGPLRAFLFLAIKTRTKNYFWTQDRLGSVLASLVRFVTPLVPVALAGWDHELGSAPVNFMVVLKRPTGA